MPVDRGAIDQQLRDIGEGDRWWEHREFRDLPHVLHADERIRGLAHGKLLGPRGPRLLPAARWLLVATDQRLLCMRQERFARKQVEIASGQITRIRASTRLRTVQLLLETPQARYRIRIPKEDAFRFAAALDPLVPEAQRLEGGAAGRSWLPGVSTIAALPGVSGLVSKMSGPPAPELAPRDKVERVEAAVERLQTEVERLQQQVKFLEDLLQTRAEDAFLQRSSAGA
jgi:hypothetical protein